MDDEKGVAGADGGLGLEWIAGSTEEKPLVASSVGFDFESVDGLEDRIREVLAKGGSVREVVGELIDAEANERVNEAIAGVISYIVDAQKPRLVAEHLAWISGMRLREGKSGTELARKHGISKEAFSQGAIKLAQALGLKPARAMRSEMSKALIRSRHYKRRKLDKEIKA